MHYQKQKKNTGKRVVVALLLLVLILGVASLAFLWISGSIGPALFSPKVEPYIVPGEVKALSLDPPVGEMTAEDMRTYFSQAAVFAQDNGFNTLVFNGKQGLSVYWRDQIFPAAQAVSAQDSSLSKLDPLAILCDEANSRGIQVWLSLNPYSSGNYTSEMKGKVVSLAKAEQPSFSPSDTAYSALLEKSLAAVPSHYPIAGIVFSGLDANTQNNVTDTAGWAAAFSEMATRLHTALAADSSEISLALTFGENGGLITPAVASSLVEGNTINYLMPSIEPGQNLSGRLATWASANGASNLIALQPQQERAGVVLFTAVQNPSYAGALVGSYPQITGLGNRLAVLTSILSPVEGRLPQGFTIPHRLSINYPAQNAELYSDSVFIMGTSDPSQPLLLDGVEVANRAPNGAFGVLAELVTGTNTFTFAQGPDSYTLQINKPAPTGGSGTSAPLQSDGTLEAQPGQAVRVNTLIASGLTDYTTDDSLNETFVSGAVGVVQESVETTRSNKKTWAYKLTSGDYVLAKNCEWIDGDGASSFTGLSINKDANGEWLTFEGAGTPAGYVAYDAEQNTLNLTFYDTAFSLPAGFQSEMVHAASVTDNDDGSVTLSLQLSLGSLWGYSLEYENGTTKLFLKKPPALSSDPAKPLAGITVMLDPGHGDTDIGAPGLMGDMGPNEKEINLALAEAISYRLRQLGATVTMTREGDTFPSLEDRLAVQMQQKPDFFLAVHHNSLNPTSDLNGVSGSQAYYYSPYSIPSSKAFAQNLLDTIAPATERKGGEARWGYYYVTRTSVCPSVLFEYGFVTNPSEFESLASTDGIWAAACATAEGLFASVPQSDAANMIG